MKKVAFPHMGTMRIGVKSFLRELGTEPIEAPPITKRTMELGVKYAPEFACLPLKVNLGNHLESIEKGADHILMAGGVGPCRFGYYAEVQREILVDLGYEDVKMLTLEPKPLDILRGFRYLHEGRLSLVKLYRILRYAMRKIKAVDDLEKIVHYVRPRSKSNTQVTNIFRKVLQELENATTEDRIQLVRQRGEEELRNLIDPNVRDDEILHVGLVGEIYLLLEPYVNVHIEERLGELGVQVHRELFLGHWIDDHILHRVDRRPYIEAAKPYLDAMIGGHGQETIGQAVLYAREGKDGVVQVAPFTCMPEIVAESIFPTVSQKENIPVLSLFFDEHSGEAGVQTRLEAFTDLIRQKRERSVVL